MSKNPVDAAEINEANRRFWKEREPIFARQTGDELLFQYAIDRVQGEMLRGVPTGSQVILEQALDEADTLRRGVLSRQAQRGGRALKSDTLQRFIEDLVYLDPGLSCADLLSRLDARCPRAPILEISDGEITVELDSGEMKDVPISGLKDRLSGAKKKFRSRQPASAN